MRKNRAETESYVPDLPQFVVGTMNRMDESTGAFEREG